MLIGLEGIVVVSLSFFKAPVTLDQEIPAGLDEDEYVETVIRVAQEKPKKKPEKSLTVASPQGYSSAHVRSSEYRHRGHVHRHRDRHSHI